MLKGLGLLNRYAAEQKEHMKISIVLHLGGETAKLASLLDVAGHTLTGRSETIIRGARAEPNAT